MFVQRLAIVSLVLALNDVVFVRAAIVSTNTIISAENSFPDETVQIVRGASPPTVVNLIDGGEVEQVIVDAESIFNMHGGVVGDAIATRDTSRVNVFGGQLARLRVGFDSIATFNAGVVTGEVRLFGSQGTPTFTMNGGRIDGNLSFQGAGIANIHGGRLDAISGIGQGYFINITGGSFSSVALWNSGTAHWSGGTKRDLIAAHVLNDSVLHVYGRGLALDNEHFLTGELLDGTVIPFNTWIDLEDNGRIFLHNVPEPTTFILAFASAMPLALCWRHRLRVKAGSA